MKPSESSIKALSIIQPLAPTGPSWARVDHRVTGLEDLGYPYAVYAYPFMFNVISAVEHAHDPGHPDVGPEYHISISRATEAGPMRCTSEDALWILGQFGASAAKEDNHVPSGKVRNFWMPVAENLIGYECPCVEDEPAMREDKGDFFWRGVTK